MAASASPLPSALDPQTQAFPKLTEAQINRIRPYGKVRQVKAGEVVFEPDVNGTPFFVLLSGRMEVVQPDMDGAERPVAKHEPGEFTGEVTMISGRRSLVRGRVTEAGDFIEVSPDNLRSLLAKDAEISEILMRAFILRRLTLISQSLGNIVLMGSGHSASTLKIREFLTRDGHPYTYVDLDTDKTSQELLDKFHVTLDEIPVVICRGGHVFRNPDGADARRGAGFQRQHRHGAFARRDYCGRWARLGLRRLFTLLPKVWMPL